MKPILRILTGCTASGKTEWALRWAEKRGAEIVSCDSLACYRGADLGTAKPTAEQRARVPHHLVDVADVGDQMDITRYVTLARAAVDDIAARGREILVVGGSGFYLKAFLAPVADEVVVPEAVRAEVRALPLAEMVARLGALNPDGLGELDLANPRRVARALERCVASGKTLAQLLAEFARRPAAFADFQARVTQVERDPVALEARITARVAAMLRDGLVAEVRALRAAGMEKNPSAAAAIGYREVLAMLDGRLAEAELAAMIAQNTRALVKKQRTWLRTQLPEHRVLDGGSIRHLQEIFPE